jgi:hypothetical protein
MNADQSESLFKDYLDLKRFEYERNYYVGPGNVDFRVISACGPVLLDVKEVLKREKSVHGHIDANLSIQNDVTKLRTKFGAFQPQHPCVLVSMNFSDKFFTGLTVSSAMHGKLGVVFDRSHPNVTSQVHHLPNGGAALQKNKNTAISGILVFDWRDGRHWFFGNPFARHPLPDAYFPSVEYTVLNRRFGSDLIDLSRLMFYGKYPEDRTT